MPQHRRPCTLAKDGNFHGHSKTSVCGFVSTYPYQGLGCLGRPLLQTHHADVCDPWHTPRNLWMSKAWFPMSMSTTPRTKDTGLLLRECWKHKHGDSLTKEDKTIGNPRLDFALTDLLV